MQPIKFLAHLPGIGREVNPQRLVRDQRLRMHHIGVELAPSLEEKHQGWLQKDAYLAKVREIDAEFKDDGASAAASTMYRRRLAHELGEDG